MLGFVVDQYVELQRSCETGKQMKTWYNKLLDFLFYSNDLPSVYLPRMRNRERLMKLVKGKHG